MNKFGQVAIVVGAVIALYIIMLAVMPVVVDMASAANVTASVGRNVTADYPGSTSFLLASPWLLWFAPGVIGMIVIVVLLKSP